MKKHNIILAILGGILLPQLLMAQDAVKTDYMNNMGKIYVVVGVLTIIFVGIIFFLIYLERKVARLENQDFEDL
ncbi:MAG: CcmD family protein [Aureispira sp.]|nr:CcmD family protein [Aureispira sp.]